MRIDGATKIAPYHYIDALFKKIRYPNINGYIKIENWYPFENNWPPQKIYHLRVSIILINLSKLQNDYTPSFNVVISKGKFEGWSQLSNDKNTKYSTKGNALRRSDIKDVIFYGEPIVETYTIDLSMEELADSNIPMTILLLFGSKNSPMKVSRYTINLDPNITQDFNKNMFVTIVENQLISEYQVDIGQTDERFLSNLLERNKA
ncbi:MAG: hypothetical protein M0D57_00530 [Sphingobacteriales bacterium JAD_PAG50586_3]|nr:MAG: hypothetical protein M0D57_00530 [Sphingobacteriales bacterium JAD_PAG50586_3]